MTTTRPETAVDTPADETDTDETPDAAIRLTREDLAEFARRIGDAIAETPEERAKRLSDEREQAFADSGETPEQRKLRHRQEQAEHRRRTSRLWHTDPTGRAARFRRWCALTAASASCGCAFGGVQALDHTPLSVRCAALAAALLLDRTLRRGGRIRVSEVRGPGIPVVIVTRIPYGTALVTVLGLGPLFAFVPHLH